MDNNELNRGFCPKCYGEIQVPKRVANFSCLYCGERLTHDMLLDRIPSSVSEDADECYNYACDNIARCITDHWDIMKTFKKDLYASSFADYTEDCRLIFENLAAAVSVNLSEREDMLRRCAARFVEDLTEEMQKLPAWSKINGKSLVPDDTRTIIALYMVPMIGVLDLPISEEFNEILRQEWIAKYPKSPFLVGNYETLAAGFKKKFLGLCFITTAVCEHDGKPDDCYELTAFRSFRDNYLRFQPGGEELIDEYYSVAPVIVNCINYCDDSDLRYREIKEKYLDRCLADIESGDLEDCRRRYTDMVNYLKNKYLPA